MSMSLSKFVRIVAALCASGLVYTGARATAAVAVLGVQYKADQAFPEHDCFWDASQYPTSCPLTNPLGGSIHVFLRNDGGTAVTVQDITFVGFSLKEVLALHYQVVKRQPASIYLADLTTEERQTLINAGEPVWYKIDPAVIAPGNTSHIVVRLRQTPTIPTIAVDVVHGAGTTSTEVPVQLDQPRLASASFSSDLARAYLYWRRAPGAGAPTTILLDGADVTANATTVSDPALNFAVSIVQLRPPLTPGSMHIFQGTYADGRKAGAGVRPWNNRFIYGQWSAMPTVPEDDYNATRITVDNALNHAINAMVVQGESSMNHFVGTSSGKQYLADKGYGFVMSETSDWPITDPLMWFIRDEPDAADFLVAGIPGNKVVGSLAQMAVQTGETLRARNPSVPTTVNIDGTFKPFNWYNYGQVPDVLMTDAYYEPRLRDAIWYTPARIPLYSKPTYRYAVTQLAQSAAEPNPVHVILYSCEYRDTSTGNIFPFPWPQSKRIEAYYALAAGAKGMSYWWFKAGYPSNGIGAQTAAALALWKEMGLFGNEIKTIAPWLVTSAPAAIAIQGSTNVWVRALASGTETLIVLVANDNYYNDQYGCHYTPASNATVTATLPTWMQSSPAAFEISPSGLSDVTTQLNGNQLQLSLGTLNLTRMIVVTIDPQLRATIQQRYEETVWPGICAFAPEYCVPQPNPPTITQHPSNRAVNLGGSATFAVVATGGSPLDYQWQKNGSNLSDGGHYSGCTTATLTISSADTADAADYRCVVTNTYGTATSNAAALTVNLPGDFDGDGDADLDDFGILQNCLTGPLATIADPLCVIVDLDIDGHVDSTDVGRFVNCMSGADVAVNPGCITP